VIVSDRDLAALQAALNGDVAAFDHFSAELRGTPGAGFTALMATAFIHAARHRFGDERSISTSDVIRFVGKVRTKYSAYDLRPSVAEEMIFSVLRGTPTQTGLDDRECGDIQITLLAALVDDLDVWQRASFFQQARFEADQWLAKASLAT
jgi:hypothetical protein